jgi:hypothetical protein
MMDEKFISVRFDKVPGQVEAETMGFKGTACQDTMKQVLGTLGTTTSTELTDDYYENPDPQAETESQL